MGSRYARYRHPHRRASPPAGRDSAWVRPIGPASAGDQDAEVGVREGHQVGDGHLDPHQGGGIAPDDHAELIDAEQHGPDTEADPDRLLEMHRVGDDADRLSPSKPRRSLDGRSRWYEEPSCWRHQNGRTRISFPGQRVGPGAAGLVESRHHPRPAELPSDRSEEMAERSTYGRAVAEGPRRRSRPKKACCTDSGHPGMAVRRCSPYKDRNRLTRWTFHPVSRIIRL